MTERSAPCELHNRPASFWVTGTVRVVDEGAPILTFEELAEAVRDAPPPTPDDVSITWDGRRLDSREKVLSFLAELDAARLSGRAVGPPLS